MAPETMPDYLRTTVAGLEERVRDERLSLLTAETEYTAAVNEYERVQANMPGRLMRMINQIFDDDDDTKVLARAKKIKDDIENRIDEHQRQISECEQTITTSITDYLLEHDAHYRGLIGAQKQLARLGNTLKRCNAAASKARSYFEYALDELTWRDTIDDLDSGEQVDEVCELICRIRGAREEAKLAQQSIDEYQRSAGIAQDAGFTNSKSAALPSISTGTNLIQDYPLKTFETSRSELRSLESRTDDLIARIADEQEILQKRTTAYLSLCRKMCSGASEPRFAN